MKRYDNAKKIFEKYDGNYYQMMRDEEYKEYESYMVPKSIELQWIREKQKAIIEKLTASENYKEIAELFALYGHYAVLIKDNMALDFMMKFLSSHKHDWDDNTIFRNINAVLSTISIVKQFEDKKIIIKVCKKMLIEILNREIKISDDYKENGQLPDYLSEGKLRYNIQNTIQYWENISQDLLD